MGFESGHITVYIILYFGQAFFFLLEQYQKVQRKKKLTGRFTSQSQLTSFAVIDYFPFNSTLILKNQMETTYHQKAKSFYLW